MMWRVRRACATAKPAKSLIYITRAKGALDYEPFGRTRSKEFTTRVAAAMNRVNPRKVRDPHGPAKASWF